MKWKVSVIVLFSLMFIVFSGCEFDSKPFTSGSFTLTINSENTGRTILPDVEGSIVSYFIEFAGPFPRPSITTAGTSALIDLPEGSWDITVSGMDGIDGTGNVVALGTVTSVIITTGTTTNATVYLSPLSVGTGSVDIVISWPVSQTVDETSTVIFDGIGYEMGVVDPETTFNGPAGTISFQISSISSGNHTFFAYLNGNNILQTTVTESVQVYDNLTSSSLIVLYPEDFNQPPGVSTLLPPVEGNNEITLIWENSSNVITGFSIERSLTDISDDYSEIASTDGVTLTYADTTVVSGTTYYYRVIAASAGGDSVPSNSVSLTVEPPVPGNSGILAFSNTTSSSTTLSWTKAADNVSAESALEYKIARSDSANVDTVSDAEANGTTVQDWGYDIDTVPLTGLTSGTTYYFNVLVRDEAGNINIYSMNSETPSLDGELDLTITVTEPNDETITFSENDDISVSQSSVLTITVSETFDSYSWYLDGVETAGQATNIFDYDCSGTSLGVHHLTVFVTLNSMLYSNTIRFIVTN